MNTDKNNTLKAVLAGSMSGVCQITSSYPIKFIKTQMQLEEKFGKDKLYKGMFDCAYQTVKNYGFLGLYRGLNVYFYAARSAVSFGTYETLKAKLIDENGVLSPTNRFLCGLLAGAVEAALINTPLETVECKLIHDQRLGRFKFKGFLHGAVEIVQADGIRSLYAGLYPSVMKQAANQGTRFFIVETLKNTYQKGDPNVPVPKGFVGIFGFIAGVSSVFVTNPLDVVKTRMQSLIYAKYKNMCHCFFKIWKEEGFYSFYRGLSPRLFRVCVEVSLTFMIYDIFRDLLKVF